MPNMAQQIKQHNNKVIDSGQMEKSGGCNGHRAGRISPCTRGLHDHWSLTKGVVYGAEVTDLTTGGKETYTGLTDGLQSTKATSATGTNLAPDSRIMCGNSRTRGPPSPSPGRYCPEPATSTHLLGCVDSASRRNT